MNRLLFTLVLVSLAINAAWSAEDHTITLYVQVIRGTDQEKPEDAAWKAIGPKLSKALSSVFAWKHFWEVKRREVVVTKGKVPKIKVTPERDLEIELVKDGQAELRLYRKGQLMRKMTVLISSKLSILGGDAAENEGWFIVVRRDRPSTE
jgi:hypothetical protein